MVVGTDASRRDRAKGRSDRWTSVALPSDLRGDSGAPYSSMNLASRGCQPMDRDKRPLSPHIQIYRPQWSSVLSIMHRITGLLLALGSLILTWWLTAIEIGPEALGAVQAFSGSLVGRILMFAWHWALFFHLFQIRNR